jgi:hypothetical protein
MGEVVEEEVEEVVEEESLLDTEFNNIKPKIKDNMILIDFENTPFFHMK